MEKADYSTIANFYDKARPLSEETTEQWMKLIKEYSKKSEGAKTLDLGCGSGRFTVPMLMILGYEMVGADLSKEMLEKARMKDINNKIVWDQQNATNLTYQSKSFDIVFMSHLLHHIDHPIKVLLECFRILNNTGVIIIRYGAIEQIRNDLLHICFPETLGIDEKRTPTIKQVEEWLTKTGFNGIRSKEIKQNTYKDPEEYFECTKNKSTSVLTLLSDNEFEKGLNRFKTFILDNPKDPLLYNDYMTMSVGYKMSS